MITFLLLFSDKNAAKKFSIDCKHPVKDGIMKCDEFELYLKEHVESGKTGYFRKDVSFEKTWKNSTQLRKNGAHSSKDRNSVHSSLKTDQCFKK